VQSHNYLGIVLIFVVFDSPEYRYTSCIPYHVLHDWIEESLNKCQCQKQQISIQYLNNCETALIFDIVNLCSFLWSHWSLWSKIWL
jgi:hypothetical protein